MSRHPPQRRNARARNGVAPYIPASFAGMPGAPDTARQRAAHPFTDAASLPLRHGMETRAPKGPGRDCVAGSVRSMTARPDARSENGNGQKTGNGRIRLAYIRLKRQLTIIRRDGSREHKERKCFSFLYCTMQYQAEVRKANIIRCAAKPRPSERGGCQIHNLFTPRVCYPSPSGFLYSGAFARGSCRLFLRCTLSRSRKYSRRCSGCSRSAISGTTG